MYSRDNFKYYHFQASIEEIMKAFAANQHSPGSPNNNALALMNSPPNNNAESIHRRHSVHSPTSPGAQQQQLGRQSHQNNSNSRLVSSSCYLISIISFPIPPSWWLHNICTPQTHVLYFYWAGGVGWTHGKDSKKWIVGNG